MLENSAFLLGIDLGSSSIKVSLVLASTGEVAGEAAYPKEEMVIDTPQPGWAEQDPEVWFTHFQAALKILQNAGHDLIRVESIGISYQMHGLVIVDKKGSVLRPAIIWCDGRAVEIGEKAADELGEEYCRRHLLNPPGNFTAAKLKWVKENEPEIFEQVYSFLLPGDYLAYRLTGQMVTTISGLTEGTFYDIQQEQVSKELLETLGLPERMIPSIVPSFGDQGRVTKEIAVLLGLREGTTIAYRAGDQPNNAFSLKALQPGEIAATAGTSGVIYGVTSNPLTDKHSRVNTFVHVNYSHDDPRYGVLLCINGTGSMNSWLKKLLGREITYPEMNKLASTVEPGAEGLRLVSFGNGPERILENRTAGAAIYNLDLNRHHAPHLCRAVQEGIVFALAYGLEIIQEMGLQANVIRAGHANMFLSDVFCEIFVNTTGCELELYNTNGALGAALGGGIGAGILTQQEAFKGLRLKRHLKPTKTLQEKYEYLFHEWKDVLHSNKIFNPS